MAAPMNFYGRAIVGATSTFTVIMFGVIFILYKSRKSAKKKTHLSLKLEKVDKACVDIDSCGPNKEPPTVSTEPYGGGDSSLSSLIMLLELTIDDEQRCRVLTTIANKAAFTDGQNAVRFAGGLPVIMHQLERHSDKVTTSCASCIANLALNAHNQPILKACIPTLVTHSTNPTHTKSLRLACLQALVNLSVSGQCGDYFSQPEALQSVFSLIQDGSSSLDQQALRVLVNLSADSTMTTALLDYKVPTGFMDLLRPNHTDESLLRTLSFLINLRRGSLSVSVPSVERSPDDISFHKLFTQNNRELHAATEILMNHGDADVKKQAERLMILLSAP